MAVIIWKDGESIRVPPERLQAHLSIGYTLEKQPKKRKPRIEIIEETEAEEHQEELSLDEG